LLTFSFYILLIFWIFYWLESKTLYKLICIFLFKIKLFNYVIIFQNHRTGYPLLDTQQKQKEQKVKTKNKKKKRSNDPTLRLLLFLPLLHLAIVISFAPLLGVNTPLSKNLVMKLTWACPRLSSKTNSTNCFMDDLSICYPTVMIYSSTFYWLFIFFRHLLTDHSCIFHRTSSKYTSLIYYCFIFPSLPLFF